MQLPYYMWYEAAHALLGPARALAESTRVFYQNPLNPVSHTSFGENELNFAWVIIIALMSSLMTMQKLVSSENWSLNV